MENEPEYTELDYLSKSEYERIERENNNDAELEFKTKFYRKVILLCFLSLGGFLFGYYYYYIELFLIRHNIFTGLLTFGLFFYYLKRELFY